ncbi:hypothetical protein HNY73_001428 [Argiope bruennichi]|uniref:Uncharacterized protein n=1 Tax=Argiope bruennichi TaxID=94029 RepID=A0A8T0G3M8_ARGBR|nr:hypothetical protein HNY73_001428 [Argiope bruennichi]
MLAKSCHSRIQLIYEGFKPTPVCHNEGKVIELRNMLPNEDVFNVHKTGCERKWHARAVTEKCHAFAYGCDGLKLSPLSYYDSYQ